MSPMPEGGFEHLFPSRLILPHLTQLDIKGFEALRLEAMSRLVRCCPALSDLNGFEVDGGPPVCELKKLTALTRLRVDVNCMLYYASLVVPTLCLSIEHLAELTTLRDLDLVAMLPEDGADAAAASSLLPLTAPTADAPKSAVVDPGRRSVTGPLEHLEQGEGKGSGRGCWAANIRRSFSRRNLELELGCCFLHTPTTLSCPLPCHVSRPNLQADPDSPDVWQQLLAHCQGVPEAGATG